MILYVLTDYSCLFTSHLKNKIVDVCSFYETLTQYHGSMVTLPEIFYSLCQVRPMHRLV